MVRTRGIGSSGAGPSNRAAPRDSERLRQRRLEERLTSMSQRAVHPQREIALNTLQGTFVTEAVEALGWGRLVSDPGPYNEDIVREFYACMDSTQYRNTGMVRMRGIDIDMSVQRINDFYGLIGTNHLYGVPDLPQFQVRGDLALALRMNDDDVWTSTHHLKSSELHLEPCFWNKFRSHNVRPSRHDHELIDIDAKIIYCIWHRIRIDVGKIIKMEMTAACEDMNVVLPFPSLICRFLHEAQIDVYGDEDKLLRPMGPLGRPAYNKMANQRGIPVLPSRYMARRARQLAREAAAQAGVAEEAQVGAAEGAEAPLPPQPGPQGAQEQPGWVAQILDGQRAILEGQRALEERVSAELVGIRDRITALEELQRQHPHGGD